MLELRELKKSFGGTTVLQGVDLTVQQGDVIAVIGPSGSGKTTLLRCMNFLETADSGTLTFDGETLDLARVRKKDAARLRRKTAFVFQSYNLFANKTALENVTEGLIVGRKMPKAEALTLARRALDQVGLANREDHYPAQLSGGQQQRVAIARALVTGPAIICMDEPLSNLDAKLRVQLRLELKKMQKDFGITTIYVTHDQEEALTLSDRIAVFNKGVIEQIGTPNEIYNHSATEFVCNFIGDINRLSDDIVEKLNAKGAQLDPTHHHYIRLERVHVNDAQHAESGAVSLSGTVESREYYGLYIKYYINVGSQTLKVIERNDGVHLHDTGDAVTVTVHPDDLMSYAPNGEEAEK